MTEAHVYTQTHSTDMDNNAYAGLFMPKQPKKKLSQPGNQRRILQQPLVRKQYPLQPPVRLSSAPDALEQLIRQYQPETEASLEAQRTAVAEELIAQAVERRRQLTERNAQLQAQLDAHELAQRESMQRAFAHQQMLNARILEEARQRQAPRDDSTQARSLLDSLLIKTAQSAYKDATRPFTRCPRIEPLFT